MTRRSKFIPFVSFAVSASLCGTSLADKIFLNSGKILDCKVLKETADSVKVEYNVTPSIIDEKEIPMSEIAKIIISTPDQEAYEKLKGYRETADLTPLSVYDDIIDNKFRVFLTRFPASPYVPQVEEMLAAYQTERSQVGSGYRKIDGAWIGPKEFERKSYNLEAKIEHREMQELLAQGNYQSGLNRFKRIENEYEGSLAYPEAIVSALDGLDSYEARLDGMIRKQPFLQSQREAGLARQDELERPKIQRAIDAEMASYEATRVAEEATGDVWRTVHEFDLEGLVAEKELIASERERLAARDIDALRKSSIHTAKAMEHFADREFVKATGEISKAAAAGADEHFIEKLKARVITMQTSTEEKLDAAAKTQAEAEEGLNTAMASRVTIPTDVSGKGDSQLQLEAKQKVDAEAEALKAAEKKAKSEALAEKKDAAKAKADAMLSQAGDAATGGSSGGGSGIMSKLPFIVAPLMIILLAVLLKKRSASKEDEE